MIEYPTINQSSKAPRQSCIGFNKYDGSNIRVKYTQKRGFDLFGSRRELFDATHPFLSEVIPLFHKDFAPVLTDIFKSKDFRDIKEITVFGEFFGPSSFAGLHIPGEPKEFVMFDVLLYKKAYNEFLLPQEFVKTFKDKVRIPEVLFDGNLSDEVIQNVKLTTNPDIKEGAVFKGKEKTGAACGKIWMCKVKTHAYLQKLKDKYGLDWELYV